MQQAYPHRAHPVPPAYPPERQVEITNGPAAADISEVSAVIWWDTDVKSSSMVRYGTSQTDLSETAGQAHNQTHHSVKLVNLGPHTTYYFRVESARQGRATASSELGTFNTLP